MSPDVTSARRRTSRSKLPMKKKLPRHSELRKEASRVCSQSKVNDEQCNSTLEIVMKIDSIVARLRAEVESGDEGARLILEQVVTARDHARTARSEARRVQTELRHRADELNRLARKAWSAERQRMRSRAAIPTCTNQRARSSHRIVVRTVASSSKASTAGPDPDPEPARRTALRLIPKAVRS